ncbi:MAG: hypothetical protein LBD99_07100 [Candidatus Margulisbacteria bacterium]|jgi:hypothetical protein|nr:hypothetical protein [Candidatus Margulisiibacteriota bacterium]
MADDIENTAKSAVPDDSVKNDEISASAEQSKAPFAENALSGMVSSVLKPQDEKEREKIEKELKKRQDKLEKQKNSGLFKKILIGLCVIALVLGGLTIAVKAPSRLRKVYRVVAAKNLAKKLRKAQGVEVWGDTQLIFADSFRLKLKSNLRADKATLILSGGAQPRNIAGRIVAKDAQSLTWEFLTDPLAKNKYTYKAFVKNSASGQFKELRGSFELK